MIRPLTKEEERKFVHDIFLKAQKRQKDQFINRMIFAIFFTVIAFTVTVIAFPCLTCHLRAETTNAPTAFWRSLRAYVKRKCYIVFNGFGLQVQDSLIINPHFMSRIVKI